MTASTIEDDPGFTIPVGPITISGRRPDVNVSDNSLAIVAAANLNRAGIGVSPDMLFMFIIHAK